MQRFLNTARIKIRSGKSAILAIAFLVWQPTIDTLVGLQQEFLFLLLFTLACWGAVRVRPWHGLIGAAIAICTIIKVYPVLMLGYFIRKEWWTSLIAFAVSFAALTVISVLLSWPGLQREFWFDVLPHLSEGTAYVENQSLLAFFDRFFVNGNLVDPSLVLLCHKFFRSKICWQHGQRGSVREIARAMAMRTEVIEFGT